MPDDTELFRTQIKGVTPLKTTAKTISHKKPRRATLIKQPNLGDTSLTPQRDISAPPPVGADEFISFHQSGVQTLTLKKLKQGKLAVEAELDLHGYTLAQAEPALERFINDAYQQQARIVRIVHGKGRSSHQDYPLIKNAVNHWLRRHGYVLAFSSVPPPLGGVGAVHVLLKKKSDFSDVL
jgi:DNA-nicking Smr family endonuclease